MPKRRIIGDKMLDLSTRALFDCEGNRVSLSQNAAKILLVLAQRAGQQVSNNELLDAMEERPVQGRESEYVRAAASLRQAIKELRRAFGERRGVGYIFNHHGSYSLECRTPVPFVFGDFRFLSERESLDANLLPNSEVYVHGEQPIEIVSGPEEAAVASQVIRNIEAGIRYRYLLSVNAKTTIDLLYSLSSLNIASNKEVLNYPSAAWERRLSLLQQSLRLYCHEQLWPFHFCLHNAGSRQHCVCYLHYGQDVSVEWARGQDAYAIAKAFDRLVVAPQQDQNRIIMASSSFNPYDSESHLMDLKQRICERFPRDALQRVCDACFGQPERKPR